MFSYTTMKNLKGLVEKYKTKFNSNIITINDLIIKEMDGEPLSCNQFQAIQNYYKIRISYLANVVNESIFSEKTYTTRLAANFVPYKEFI